MTCRQCARWNRCSENGITAYSGNVVASNEVENRCPMFRESEDKLINKAIREVSEKVKSEFISKIKDSGDRRQFYDKDGNPTAVRDMSEGKGRMDLLPWDAIMEVSKHCENGAKKYGEHNVDKGLPVHSFCDSGMRHLAKYVAGWDDEPHLLAAAWTLLWAIQMELKHPEMCDIPWKE